MGSAASMRRSSVIRAPLVLRNVEVNAHQDPLPARVDVARALAWPSETAVFDVVAQVGDAAGVAPLVVVPGDDLDHIAQRQRVHRAEDGRVRVALQVAGDERLLGVRRGCPSSDLRPPLASRR